MLVESFGRRPPAESFSRAAIESSGHRIEVFGRIPGQVSTFREVLAQEAVGVLVGTPLPWAVRVAEINGQSGVDAEFRMLSHLGALVPCQRATKLLWESCNCGRDGISDGFSAMPRQRRSILQSRLTVARHARQMEQHPVSG